jgi:response regulator RpfG family c-di-GMP phosphodiesterase
MREKNDINVLYVDDEIKNLESFKAAFRREFNVFTALSANEAESILETNNEIHVIVSDQRMPGKLGTEFLEQAVSNYPNQTGILLTAFCDDEEVLEAEKKKYIYRAVEKPWEVNILKEYIEEGYDIYQKLAQRSLKK